MEAETLAELRAELVEVKSTISKARRSKGWSEGVVAVTRQELKDLLGEKNDLIKKINAKVRGGIRMRSMKIL